MVILEKHFLVIEKTGSTCNVRPFYTELGIAADASIIDVAIAYNYQYKKTTYMLIASNALLMPTMEHNLIPPFIMRAGGVIVSDVPNMHCVDPTIEYHCIWFKNSDLKYLCSYPLLSRISTPGYQL